LIIEKEHFMNAYYFILKDNGRMYTFIAVAESIQEANLRLTKSNFPVIDRNEYILLGSGQLKDVSLVDVVEC
jgi:hypothetical protein